MAVLERLLEVGVIARAISENFLYRRFASRLAVVVVSAVVTGMLAGALLVAGLYAVYLGLIQHGMDVVGAALVVGAATLLTTIVCGVVTLHLLRKLKDTLQPLSSGALQRIGKAFLDGFTQSGKQ